MTHKHTNVATEMVSQETYREIEREEGDASVFFSSTKRPYPPDKTDSQRHVGIPIARERVRGKRQGRDHCERHSEIKSEEQEV